MLRGMGAACLTFPSALFALFLALEPTVCIAQTKIHPQRHAVVVDAAGRLVGGVIGFSTTGGSNLGHPLVAVRVGTRTVIVVAQETGIRSEEIPSQFVWESSNCTGNPLVRDLNLLELNSAMGIVTEPFVGVRNLYVRSGPTQNRTWRSTRGSEAQPCVAINDQGSSFPLEWLGDIGGNFTPPLVIK
jgi:hypothetical protein